MKRKSLKLEKAMEEINDILRAHDIAGVVVLHTPGYAKYAVWIEPSYSIARMEDNGVRVKTDPKEDYNTKKKKLEDTANMFSMLAETIGRVAMDMMEVSESVDRHLGANHSVFPKLGDN